MLFTGPAFLAHIDRNRVSDRDSLVPRHNTDHRTIRLYK